VDQNLGAIKLQRIRECKFAGLAGFEIPAFTYGGLCLLYPALGIGQAIKGRNLLRMPFDPYSGVI